MYTFIHIQEMVLIFFEHKKINLLAKIYMLEFDLLQNSDSNYAKQCRSDL